MASKESCVAVTPNCSPSLREWLLNNDFSPECVEKLAENGLHKVHHLRFVDMKMLEDFDFLNYIQRRMLLSLQKDHFGSGNDESIGAAVVSPSTHFTCYVRLSSSSGGVLSGSICQFNQLCVRAHEAQTFIYENLLDQFMDMATLSEQAKEKITQGRMDAVVLAQKHHDQENTSVTLNARLSGTIYQTLLDGFIYITIKFKALDVAEKQKTPLNAFDVMHKAQVADNSCFPTLKAQRAGSERDFNVNIFNHLLDNIIKKRLGVHHTQVKAQENLLKAIREALIVLHGSDQSKWPQRFRHEFQRADNRRSRSKCTQDKLLSLATNLTNNAIACSSWICTNKSVQQKRME